MASLRFRLRQRYWRWTAPGKIRGYMRDHSPRKLQIGAGDNLLPGWLNTTLYPFAPGAVFLDARLPFPIPDAQFDYVFSEHVIEHLEFDEAAHMLAEARRILRPADGCASPRPIWRKSSPCIRNRVGRRSKPTFAGSWILFVRRSGNIIRRTSSTSHSTAGVTSSSTTNRL